MSLRREVDPATARMNGWCVDYEGKTYCEDSEEHHRMFQQDPEKYLREASDKGIMPEAA